MSSIRPKTSRIGQRRILRGSIRAESISGNLIKDTATVQEDIVVLPNGSQLNVTSTVIPGADPDIRVAVCPFSLVMFQDSLNTANIIPFGSNVDNDVYQLTGPIAMPRITQIGNDGFNAVYKTALYNGTGSNQDIIIVSQARYILSTGGTAS